VADVGFMAAASMAAIGAIAVIILAIIPGSVLVSGRIGELTRTATDTAMAGGGRARTLITVPMIIRTKVTPSTAGVEPTVHVIGMVATTMIAIATTTVRSALRPITDPITGRTAAMLQPSRRARPRLTFTAVVT